MDLAKIGKPSTVSASVTSGGGGWLPRIALMAPLSKQAEDHPEWVGKFALIKSADDATLLGPDVLAAVVAARPKAVAYKPEFLEAFQPQSDLFKELAERANAKDSANYGVELLIVLDKGEMATFYLSSPSARNQAASFEETIGKAIIISSKKVSKNGKTWRIPTATVSSTPIKPTVAEAEVAAQIEKFLNAVPHQEKQQSGR